MMGLRGCNDGGSKVNESNRGPCAMRVVCGIVMEMRIVMVRNGDNSDGVENMRAVV